VGWLGHRRVALVNVAERRRAHERAAAKLSVAAWRLCGAGSLVPDAAVQAAVDRVLWQRWPCGGRRAPGGGKAGRLGGARVDVLGLGLHVVDDAVLRSLIAKLLVSALRWPTVAQMHW
jgi:hypothetical protein